MMVRKSFLLFFLAMAVLLFACSEKRPEGILSEDQMVVMLTDFYLKESKINTLGLQPDSSTTIVQYYKDLYVHKNGLPDSALDKSYQFYLENPNLLSKIYDRVIDSLALQEQKGHASGVH